MQSQPCLNDLPKPFFADSSFGTSHIAPYEVFSSLQYHQAYTSPQPSHEDSSPSYHYNDPYYDDGHPILMRIHCFGVDVVVDIRIPTNGDIQWGFVAYRALRRWRELLPPKLTSEHRLFLQNYIPAEGPYDIIIYEPRNRIIHRPHEVLPIHSRQWCITDPPVSYRLVIEGPLLHRFTNEQLQNIFGEYLITNPKNILPLILTCKRFKQAFSHHSFWSKMQWSQNVTLFRWQGIGGHNLHPTAEDSSFPFMTEENLWRSFACDHNLNALETTKLRFASYRTSRLKFFYGTLSSPALSSSHSIPAATWKFNSPSFSSVESLIINTQQKDIIKLSNPCQYNSHLLLWEDAIVRDQILKWILQRFTSPLSYFGKVMSVYFPTSVIAANQLSPEHILPVWTLSHYKEAPSIQEYMRKFFQQLHFIVPTTATRFHLQLPQQFPSNPKSNRGGTLFPYGQLLNIEASPQKSRSQSLPVDPGTRLEMTSDGDCYRRIGDLRLTFIQCEADSYFLSTDESNMLGWMRSPMRDFLLDKTLGTVLWLSLPTFEYSICCNSWKISNSVLYSTIIKDLRFSIQRLRESMTTSNWLPLIIFVGLSFEDSILKQDANYNSCSSKITIETPRNVIAKVTTEIAFHVKEAFSSMVTTEKLPNCPTSGSKKTVLTAGRMCENESKTFVDAKTNLPCQWYIQPYNQDANLENLQEGILPGWNWLWRTLAKQRDQNSNGSR